MTINTADNEELFIRRLLAYYMSYRAAVLQNDGYMINLYYGYMNNTKRVLKDKDRFGRTDEELQALIARAEETITDAIKNGRPASRPCPSPSYSNAIKL